MKKKKVILLGFPSPVRMRDKSYVIRKLYERASSNPFVSGKSYDEYREYLCSQIREHGDVDVHPDNVDIIYDELKSMGWIKVVSAVLLAITSSHIAVS